MLTDSFLDKRTGLLPEEIVCDVLAKVCVPLAGVRIVEMRDGNVPLEHLDAMLMELELCIGLIFKPVRHHIKAIVDDPVLLASLWIPTLDTLKVYMGEGSQDKSKDGSPHSVVVKTINELTMDHLRNIVTVLISFGVLRAGGNEISEQTWKAISALEFCKTAVAEWKFAAASPPSDGVAPDVGVI